MRPILITWHDPKGCPQQGVTCDVENLTQLVGYLTLCGITTDSVVNMREAVEGDCARYGVCDYRDFPS